MADSAPKGWLQTVLAALQGGDEGKLKRLQKKAIKQLEDSKLANNREIEEKRERIADLRESLSDTVSSPDVEQIKTTEAAKSYARSYVSSLKEILGNIKDVENGIEHLEEENAVYEEVLELLQ